ncbi:hypothetical protein GPZ77_13955 [Streptomyces sp. QHH-9511]|nr:hypothetical protein GPZ77_13955 [Streptomyces sp. QHH-9511]
MEAQPLVLDSEEVEPVQGRAIAEASSRVRVRSGFGRSRTQREVEPFEQPGSTWIWS